jgi:hypothetical protein
MSDEYPDDQIRQELIDSCLVVSETDIAWAAGLLEGEGSFLKKTKRKTILISCQMTDLDVLQRLKTIFGGSIYNTTKAKPHHKDAWSWCIFGTNAARVMELIKPYMLARRYIAIEEVLEPWYKMKTQERSQQRRILAAGRAYLAGEGSLRQIGEQFTVSHEAVRRAAFREKQGPLA